MTYAIRIVNNKIDRKWPSQDPRYFSSLRHRGRRRRFLNIMVCRSRFRLGFFFASSSFPPIRPFSFVCVERVVCARSCAPERSVAEIPETRLILIPFLTLSR